MSFDEMAFRLDGLEYERDAQLDAGQRPHDEIIKDFNRAADALFAEYQGGAV